MSTRLAALCTAVFLALAPAASAALAQSDAPRAQVMVLGVYHFTGGGTDYINPAVDDYLSPQRQAEIETLVDHLSAFAPTRIVVELTPDRAEAFNAAYAAYRRGEHSLTVNERQQIGMRLAAQLDHDRVYAADFASSMDFQALQAAADRYAQSDLMARLDRLGAEIADEDRRLNRADVPVLDRLAAANAPSAIARHDVYLTLAQIGAPGDPVGAEQMAAWWARNMQIFAQIAWIAEPGERVLVIYGSGHKYLLDQFIDGAAELQLVDPLDYLE